MSKKQSSGASPVSLFPFLAVLMCTMGALILLLVVTSRRARERALVTAPVPSPIVPQLPPAVSPVVLPPVAVIPAVDPRDQQPLMPELVLDPGESLGDYRRKEAALRREWQHRIAELQQQTEPLRQSLAAETGTIDAIRAQVAQLVAEEASLKSRQEAVEGELSRIAIAERNLLVEREKNSEQLPQLESRLQEISAARAEASSQYALVAYDGRSGTSFEPIVLECTADKIRFARDDIGLTPAQLAGYGPGFNPLRSAVAALATHRLEHRPAGSVAQRPYVLFFVRPDGSEAYYVARSLLGDLPLEFGIELVTDDLKFTWPASEPEEAALVKDAIAQSLSERQRIAGGRFRGGGTPGDAVMVDTADGAFHLGEIQEIREPSDQRRSFDRPGLSRLRTSAPQMPDSRIASRGASSSNGTMGAEGMPARQGDSSGSGSSGRQGLDDSQGGSGTKGGSDPADVIGQPGASGLQAASPGLSGSPNAAPLSGGNAISGEHEGSPNLSGAPPGGMTRSQQGSIDSPRSQTGQGGSLARSSPPQLTETPDAEGVASADPSGRDSRLGAMGSRRSGPAGLRRTGPGQRSGGGPSSSGTSPSRRLRDGSSDDAFSQTRHWGQNRGIAKIGYERNLMLDVFGDRIVVGKDLTLPVASTATREQIEEAFMSLVDEAASSWGDPPVNFYWVPRITLRVHPGGNVHTARLKGLVEGWGLRVTIDQKLE